MKEIDNIVKKVLMESLNEKAEELTKKIKGEMEEDFGPEDYDYEPEDMTDYRRFKRLLDKKLNMDTEDSLSDIELEEETDVMSGEFDYVQEKECMEGDCGEMKEGKKFRDELKKAYSRKHPNEKYPESLKKKYSSDDEDEEEETKINEKLVGGQKKLDVAEPKGKLTKADFDKLRSKKEVKEKWEGDTEVEKTGEYSNMSVADLDKAIKSLKSKTAKIQDEGKKVPKLMREKMSELYFAKRAKQGWKGKGSAKVDEEMEEGNAFTGALAKAKKEGDDTFEVDGKEYNVKNESYKYSIKFDGEELILSEEELVNMIEEIVLEEKNSNLKSSGGRAKGTVEYDRVHKKDEDINKKANQESFKKMREYVKAGSKGSFEENPKFFPKGNGQLAKMDKKAYVPSEAVDEYIDTFAYGGGMLDLDPDEIGYNEDWLEKTIEGSEMTGNSPKYANAEDTGLGKKLNKRRKLGLYNQEKRQSYNRVKQPVDVAGEDTKSGKLNKMFKNLGESTEQKEILSEEMSKMKNMMGYNKKTQ